MMNKYSKYGLTFLCAYSVQALASVDDELSDLPLFLGNSVKPNVLFIMDDSGSMENEIMLSPGAYANSSYSGHNASGAAFDRNIKAWHNWYGNKWKWWGMPTYDRTYADHADLLRSCVGYSSLAYNPDLTYEPWYGYTDAPITAAPLYPIGKMHDNKTSQAYYYANATVNLEETPSQGVDTNNPLKRGYGYVRWDDEPSTGTPGVFDPGECGEGTISNWNNPTNANIDNAHFVPVSSMTAEEKTNYANWFTYHRKRRFSMTSPMLDILSETTLRVGVATINKASDVALEIDDTVDSNGLDTGQRAKAINSILEVGQQKSTPLRRPLENAGRYFSGESVDWNFIGPTSNPGSPILSKAEGGECQHNYTMLLTDGYSNEGGNTPSVNYGNKDKNDTEYGGYPYEDDYSNTMADIAMYYYSTDLDTNLDGKVKSKNPEDLNEEQHMVTYTVAFGLAGNITTGMPVRDENGAWTNVPTWPNANNNLWVGEKKASLDDLMHAAFNGRGDFLSALNPIELKASLNEVVESILSNSEFSAASIGFNSTNISDGTKLYQSRFEPQNWSGDLVSFDFSSGNSIVSTQEPDLKAGEILSDRVADKGHADRIIVTHNGTKGVPFTYVTTGADALSTAQINDLAYGAPVDDPATGENEYDDYMNAIVAWLRGDNTDPQFRQRKNGFVLGDIAHSSPQIVGKPSEPYPNHIESSLAPYSTFVNANAAREKVVYVGANDGMVHAFKADTLDELFAYIPSHLYSSETDKGLHWLANPNYTHKPYIDGTPTTGDVYIGSAWKTYLVGGFGAGARGIYVLDVTDPASFTSEASVASKIVMEFTDDQLGYTFARPQIAKLNNGEWVAIFGNGYANDHVSADGIAYLYILYLDGHEGAGTSGPSFRKISTKTGPATGTDCKEIADCNGLSSPTLIDLTGDAKVDRVYAGDLWGNMWAFDLSDSDPTKWAVAHSDATNQPMPFFVACSGVDAASSIDPTTGRCLSTTRQSITVEPAIVGHAEKNSLGTKPNTFVMFGTGTYLTQNDINNTQQQSFYAAWDAGAAIDNLAKPLNRFSNLQEQVITEDAKGYRTLSKNNVNYNTQYGWYMNLPDSGERSVITPVAAGELILFATSIPESAACSEGGSGHLMAASIFEGQTPPFQVFDVDPDQASVAIDQLPVGTSFIDNKTVVPDASGGIQSINTKVSKEALSRRVNWSIIR
ncbi:pilus assembly protein [Agaribacterium sp. ZY112]|uniref:pilus assembly protein n=1 Tax=Agaribacterium sp. ZY112 TaxID=3233574 RepID=UPI00352324A8